MIPIENFIYPDDVGKFGTIRKYDVHTGIDLYCEKGSKVHAIEGGIVANIIDFTGNDAGSPWWNSTKAVLIEGKSGVICYGEVEPRVMIGQTINEGDVIAVIKEVLKKYKGRPTSMLHLELYNNKTRDVVRWPIGTNKPQGLLDPTHLIEENE